MRRFLCHDTSAGGGSWSRRIGLLWVLVVAGLIPEPIGLAQSSGESQPSVFAMGEPAGFYQFRPGGWGLVSAEVWNPTSEPMQVLAVSTFEVDQTVQYGREFWIPAESKRKVSYPVRIPSKINEATRRLEVRSRLYDRTSGKEVLLRRPGDPMWHKSSIRVYTRKNITGYYPDYVHGEIGVLTGDEQYSELMEAARDTVLETVKVSRRFMDMKEWRVIPTLDENSDLPWSLAMGAVDELILGGNRLAAEPEARQSVRSWVNRGGRLWVMLDHTNMHTVRLLLGDAFPGYEVDRVNLSRYTIIPHDDTLDSVPELREPEIPVELTRLVVDGVEVTHSVDGWPAAFWLKYGQGEILFTALDLRAWSRPRREIFIRPRGIPGEVLDTAPLQQLAERFFSESKPAVWGEDDFGEYIGQQIGYQIVAKHWVILILGMFCTTILLAGLWLGRVGHLERLLWFGPVVALVTAVMLSILGKMSRESVPPTVAVAQWVAPVNHSQFVPIQGMASIYSQDKSTGAIGVDQGGILWLAGDASGDGGRRLIWTDQKTSRWENFTLPEGVRETAFQRVVPLEQPLAAYATLSESGISGRLQAGPFEEVSDLLLMTPAGDRYTVNLEGDQFQVGLDDRLKKDEFFGELVLEDEQRHRQQVLKDLLQRSVERKVPFPSQPTIMAWAKPLEIGLAFPGEHERLGSALLAVPLHLEPTPRGESFRIPSWLLGIETAASKDGKEAPDVYGDDLQKWLGKKFDPRRIWLRVQLPEQVLPASLSQAVVKLDVECDQFDLELLGWEGEDLRSVQKLENPVGAQSFQVAASELLALDDRGGLLLVLQAVPGEQQTSRGAAAKKYSWEIKSLSIELAGRRLEP